MITILGFARLCGCNAQTLRYYDRIGLLTPAKVDEYMDFVERRMDNPELWKELGLDAEQEAEVTANVHDLLADWLSQCRKMGEEISLTADGQMFSGMENIMDQLKSGMLDHAEELLLSRDSSEVEKDVPADARLVFERSGWDHVSEWIGEVPNLGNGKQKYFVFRVREDSPVADAGFPSILLGVMAARYDAMDGGMSCMVSRSSDGINHFMLMQK